MFLISLNQATNFTLRKKNKARMTEWFVKHFVDTWKSQENKPFHSRFCANFRLMSYAGRVSIYSEKMHEKAINCFCSIYFNALSSENN